ncbi:MAG: antitoxin [Chloroflexi bacterium]|nr:MAG: antitoxin [Chloroflexota bacterium]
MTQLTVRGVGRKLHDALKLEANRRGVSVNRVVLALLREALGLSMKQEDSDETFHDLDHLAGTWTDEDAETFMKGVEDQRKIDEALWS